MADARLDGSVSASCLDDATIASFVDGTIDADSRRRVVAHIASCPDCYELVTGVLQIEDGRTNAAKEHVFIHGDATGEGVAPSPKVLPFRRRGLAAAAAIVAVAASVLFGVFSRGSELDTLVDVVGSERLTMARPTGGFHYGPLRSPLRGSVETGNLQLAAEAARLQERATSTKAPADLHALGVAQLLSGDIDASIGSLQSAAQSRPRDAALRADLGAAHMTRFVNTGDQAEATAALTALDEALALSPSVKEASFNKALLLQQLERYPEAVAAWNNYLELSDDAGWRDEAVRNRDAAQRQSSQR